MPSWCLLFVLIRQGLTGGSGPLRLIRAPGIETRNPIMTFEKRSSFLPSFERAPHQTSLLLLLLHHTSPRILYWCLLFVLIRQGLRVLTVCVCLLLVRARAKRKGNKYGATSESELAFLLRSLIKRSPPPPPPPRSAGDYRRKWTCVVLTFCINSTRA